MSDDKPGNNPIANEESEPEPKPEPEPEVNTKLNFGVDLNVSRDERERIDAEILPEAKALYQDQPNHLWEAISEAAFIAYGGNQLTSPIRIDREIEIQKRRKRDAYERMQDARDDYKRRKQRIEELQERKEQLTAKAQSKTDALDDVLQDMDEMEQHAAVGVGRVPTLANQWFGGNEQAAVDALRERADETDVDIPEYQFSDPRTNDVDGPTTVDATNELKSLAVRNDGGGPDE